MLHCILHFTILYETALPVEYSLSKLTSYYCATTYTGVKPNSQSVVRSPFASFVWFDQMCQEIFAGTGTLPEFAQFHIIKVLFLCSVDGS